MNLYLLDLDRTAFKTDEHFADFCQVLKDKFDIDPNALREHEHKLQVNPSPYSPLDDLRYSQVIDIDTENVREVATSTLASNGKDYVYPDAERFITRVIVRGDRVVLITVGTHEYQQHKVSLSALLSRLPLMITRQPKSQLLAQALKFKGPEATLSLEDNSQQIVAEKVYLIDDRAGTFDDALPEQDIFKSVRIVRKDAAYSNQPTPAGIREIKSLDEIDK